MFYIINNKKNYLSSSSWRHQFSAGLRGFSKNSALSFKTFEEAQSYIDGMLFYLSDWISVDVPKQSERFLKKEDFLISCQKIYEKNTKKIKTLKIVNNFNLN